MPSYRDRYLEAAARVFSGLAANPEVVTFRSLRQGGDSLIEMLVEFSQRSAERLVFTNPPTPQAPDNASDPVGSISDPNLRRAVREFERKFIAEVLNQAENDKRLAARMLGVSAPTLYQKLKTGYEELE